MYYRIRDGRVYDFADYQYAEDCLTTDIIDMDGYFEDPLKVKIIDNVLAINPNYAADKAAKLKEEVQYLTCTKRVMALVLQEYGVDYTTLKNLIATNPQAQLEWDLCERLERSNPLLNIFGEQLGITEEQIDNIFLYANGLITEEALRQHAGSTNEQENGGADG